MIKYIKLLSEYLFNKKTLVLLILTALVPSVLIGIYLRPMEELFVLTSMDAIKSLELNFFEIYWRTSGFNESTVMTIISLFVLLCAITVMVATVDRHMRIGDLKFRNPFRRINENFWVVFPILAILIVVKEVFDILALLFAYLWIYVTTGFTAILLTSISYILVYGVFCICVAMCVSWIPHTLNTGLSAPKTFSSSVKLMRGKILPLALMIGLPCIPIALLNVLGIIVGGVLNMFTCAVTYFVLMVYLVPLIYVVYYDAMGLEREDLNNISIWKRPYVR